MLESMGKFVPLSANIETRPDGPAYSTPPAHSSILNLHSWTLLQHTEFSILLRKLQGHHRANTFLAIYANLSPMLTHDAFYNHEAQSRTDFLGRVIGLEYSR